MAQAFGNSKDGHCKLGLEQIVVESKNVGSSQIRMQHVAQRVECRPDEKLGATGIPQR